VGTNDNRSKQQNSFPGQRPGICYFQWFVFFDRKNQLDFLTDFFLLWYVLLNTNYMSFKIRVSEKFVTKDEMKNYLDTMADVRRMIDFVKGDFDEKKWLSSIIENANSKCKGLVEAYSLNSGVMSYNEVEAWKRVFNEYSLSRNLHMRIYFDRFGEDFELPE